MPKINYDKFIKYLIEHSTSDEFKNALYAQGLYFDNDELKQIEYKPKFKIGDRITDGRWTYTVKDIDLFNNLYSLENDNGYKTNMVFSYIDKECKLVENTTENTTISTELTKSEDDVRRRSTIQVLEYARSLDNYNQYGKADIDKNIAWLEKQNYAKRDTHDTIETIKRKIIDLFDTLVLDQCFSIGGLKYDILKIINDAKIDKQKQPYKE